MKNNWVFPVFIICRIMQRCGVCILNGAQYPHVFSMTQYCKICLGSSSMKVSSLHNVDHMMIHPPQRLDMLVRYLAQHILGKYLRL
jgi:hypothetical protein